jgi:hypothetical protein
LAFLIIYIFIYYKNVLIILIINKNW